MAAKRDLTGRSRQGLGPSVSTAHRPFTPQQLRQLELGGACQVPTPKATQELQTSGCWCLTVPNRLRARRQKAPKPSDSSV